MAVSVLRAAGVVTTQKAAAQPTITPIVVNYKPGATYRYTPKQFNLKETHFYPYAGNAKHFEAATGGATYSSIRTLQTQAGDSRAEVGAWWKLNLLGADWTTVQNMPCKVTMKVLYHIEAKGSDSTVAQAYWGPMIMGAGGFDYVKGNNLIHAKSAGTTTTWQGTVGDLFWDAHGDGSYYAGASARIGSVQNPDGVGQSSAALVCSSIVLEFPAS